MNGPRSPSLLVYLMALFILLAFLLAFTLVVTAGPFSNPSDNYHLNSTKLSGNTAVNASQCLADEKLSVQETCPEDYNTSNFWDIFFRRQ